MVELAATCIVVYYLVIPAIMLAGFLVWLTLAWIRQLLAGIGTMVVSACEKPKDGVDIAIRVFWAVPFVFFGEVMIALQLGWLD